MCIRDRNRVSDAGRSIISSVSHLGESAWNATQGAWDVAKGFGKLATFNKEGFGDIWNGVKGIAGSTVNGILGTSGKIISALQTLTGIERPGRRLSVSEQGVLNQVYGDSIDLESVRIKEGSMGLFGIGNFLNIAPRAFVHGNTIYMGAESLNGEVSDKHLLTHELAHVMQYQSGGLDYMRRALWEQMTQGNDAYKWEKGVSNGLSFEQLGVEQQACLLYTSPSPRDATLSRMPSSA